MAQAPRECVELIIHSSDVVEFLRYTTLASTEYIQGPLERANSASRSSGLVSSLISSSPSKIA